MEREKRIIQVDEELLGEMIAKYTRSKESVTSNFIQQFSNTITSHTEKIDNLIKTTEKNTEAISNLKEAQATFNGGKSALTWLISIGIVVIIGLVGVIYDFQSKRISTVEAQVNSLYEKR